jgi:hypothetical protein
MSIHNAHHESARRVAERTVLILSLAPFGARAQPLHGAATRLETVSAVRAERGAMELR